MSDQLIRIPIDQIEPHPHNPRGVVHPASVQELADSIKEKGILEPVLVVEVRDKGRQWKTQHYLLVAGHRRVAAARMAGLADVPAIVRELSPIEQEEIMLVENLQREDLTLLQEARAFQRLIDQGVIQSDIARKTGINSSQIALRLAILKLPASIQKMYTTDDLPVTLARLLLKVEPLSRQQRLAKMVADRKLSVPKLEEMVKREMERARPNKGPKKPDGRAKPAEIYTRVDAVQELEAQPKLKLTHADVVKAFDDVCERCNMLSHPEICTACPLPKFVRALVRKDAAHTV